MAAQRQGPPGTRNANQKVKTSMPRCETSENYMNSRTAAQNGKTRLRRTTVKAQDRDCTCNNAYAACGQRTDRKRKHRPRYPPHQPDQATANCPRQCQTGYETATPPQRHRTSKPTTSSANAEPRCDTDKRDSPLKTAKSARKTRDLPHQESRRSHCRIYETAATCSQRVCTRCSTPEQRQKARLKSKT